MGSVLSHVDINILAMYDRLACGREERQALNLRAVSLEEMGALAEIQDISWRGAG